MDSSSYHCWTNNSWLIHLSPSVVFFSIKFVRFTSINKTSSSMFYWPFGAVTVSFRTQRNKQKNQKNNATWLPCEACPKCLVSVEVRPLHEGITQGQDPATKILVGPDDPKERWWSFQKLEDLSKKWKNSLGWETKFCWGKILF